VLGEGSQEQKMSLDGVEETVRMLLRRGCLSARSRSWRRLPTEDSLYGGTTRRLVAEERRGRRSAISAVRLSGPRYRGAAPHRTL